MIVDNLAGNLLALAGILTAAGVVWRALRLGSLLRGTRLFLEDWQGEPARPGVEARPSVPERLALVEQRSAGLSHAVRGELSSRLALLGEGVDELRATSADVNGKLLDLAVRVAQLDSRVDDHRERNRQQVESLRVEVERRLAQLGVEVVRAEAYHAALLDLGLPVGPALDTTHPLRPPRPPASSTED